MTDVIENSHSFSVLSLLQFFIFYSFLNCSGFNALYVRFYRSAFRDRLVSSMFPQFFFGRPGSAESYFTDSGMLSLPTSLFLFVGVIVFKQSTELVS